MNYYIGTINTLSEKINLFGEYEKFVGPFLGDESEKNAIAHFDKYFKDNTEHNELKFGLFETDPKGNLVLVKKL